MSEIQPFTFPATGAAVRVVTVDGEPWFVVADVCTVLGLTNPTMAAGRLAADDLSTAEVIDSMGRPQQARVCNESGLYDLILDSRKPEARAFRRWITAEVVPAIRKTGSYQAAPAHPLPRTFSEALRELADAVEQRDAAEQRITELQPAADAWEKLADAKGDYSVREAAQILSRDPLITTGQNRLFAYMRHIGWLDKSGTPYQTQVDLGRILPIATSYSHPRTGDRMASSQVRVTPKGLKELRSRLAGQQQLVVIEGGA